MKEAVYSLILLQLLVVSWLDIKQAKIRNYWPLLNLVLTPVLYWLAPDMYLWSWNILVFPFLIMIAGFFLYVINVMGAGDSKYLASLLLITPINYHWQLMDKLILSTILVALVMIAVKLVRQFVEIRAYLVSGHWSGLFKIFRSRFSYAPVILLSWILLGVQKWF